MRGLIAFKEDSFIQALKVFFKDLQVPVNYIADEPANAAAILGDKYKSDNPAHKLIDDVYVLGMVDDAIFEVQNQLFKEEWTTARLQKINKDYDGLVIFGVMLKQREGDLLPTRSQLAEITRAFNRTFHYTPVTVVFKYGNYIAFANSERAKYKQEWREGERVGKVTMLKDVSIEKTHSGHIRILLDMQITRSGKDAVTSFSGLYKYWQGVFNVSTLNKSFYSELFNWYLWALTINVKFPQIRPQEDMLDDKVHQSESLIRLLTRLLFCWFMKEKGLIKDDIFNPSYINTILKEFQGKDSDETIYYKAILQNLFFATLSKPIAERKLIGKEFPNPHYGDQLVYRYVEFFNNDVNILELFSSIPFLNGGLFDCLDQRKDKDNSGEIRLDGFSNTKSKQPVVPDKLFFGEYKNIDLSGKLYDKKKSNQTVHGLIDILYRYKFTIEENTPVEEEIALDPELLGKVFENLLASYNPETKTTARKQTGSFFTPREIVNNMVDESLVAYLEQQMKDHIPELKEMDSLKEVLREVLSYTEKEHPFNDKEVDVLIQALDKLKTLDPACGSGAFPMGVLQKMLHLLRKIDPENKKWFEKVIAKFPVYLQNEMRSKLQHENWDYVRKLGIIQECIYGVDIQPIAIQIAKLRFFISLLVDQKEKPGMDNRGFEPLPNLDFKLVAANTLISPPETDAPENGLFADTFTVEFEKLTGQYFSAYMPEEKKSIKEQIATLITRRCNEKIKQIESRTEHTDERARKALKEKHKDFIREKEREIALWKSYKNLFKQESVGFFDTKYFFPGVTDGFNIVIGNPPYIAIAALPQTENNSLSKQHYETFSKGADIYCLFYEKGISLLKPSGILAYISSNRFCFTNYGIGLRKYLSQNNILQLINFNEINVFESANVGSIVTLIQNCKPSGNMIIVNEVKGQFDPIILSETCKLIESKFYQNSQWSFDESDSQNLKCKIESMGIPFIKWKGLTINRGITTGANNVFIIGEAKRNELIRENANSKEILIPVLRGANIKRYSINRPDQYLIFTYTGIDIQRYPSVYKYLKSYKSLLEDVYEAKHGQKKWYELRKCSYYDNFSLKKLVWTRLSNKNAFAISTKGEFTVDSSSFAIGDDIEYLAAILNSKVVFYYFRLGSVIWGKDGIKWFGEYFDNIPIPNISINNKAPFNTIVNLIGAFNNISVNHVNSLTTYFERLIDAMVYELYLPDEIKAAGCEVLKHLNNLPELKDDWSDEQKLATIEKLHKELSDPSHPVSIAMKKMQDIPEIRIIEGRQ